MTNPDFMLLEMLEQPKILDIIYNDSRIKDIADFLKETDVKRVYLTGSGDSYCAALFGALLAEKWCPNIVTRHYAPFELINYSYSENLADSVVVGISVSGNTLRVVEAVRYARKHGAKTICITDNPKGRLIQETDRTVFTHASPPEPLLTTEYKSEGAKEYVGYHHDVAQTKTYIANLAALSILIAHLSRNTESALNSISQAIQMVRQAVNQHKVYLDFGPCLYNVIDKVFFVASGPNSSTSLFGTYKLYEFTLNGFACDIEEYCHTGYLITAEKTLVIFIAPDSASLNRIMEIEPVIRDELNAKTVILANEKFQNLASPHLSISSPDDVFLSPLVFTIPIEFISYSLAKSKGFNTNKFRGGVDTEKYVAGSYKTIRQSKLHY